MTRHFSRLWCRGTVLRIGGIVAVLCLFGGGSPVAFGQVSGDSTTVDTVRGPDREPVRPAPPDSVRPEDVAASDTGGTGTAKVNADSLSALERDGERVQELFDNVFVRQDTTRLQSDFALRYLNRDVLLFTGDVVIYERGDTLRADTVRYNKRTKVGRARGNVRLTDGEVVVRAPRATYYTQEKRSVFPDSVTLVDSSRVLRAQSGTYWSDARRAEFDGNVHLTDPETHLESDSLTYFRDEERSIATGRVFIRRVGADPEASSDTTERTYLFGDWADNQEQDRYSRVEGQALLVRVRMDSTGTPEDTLVVRARQLEAHRTDTYRRLIAVDSVRIWQTDLAAVADSAVYDRVISAGVHDTTDAPTVQPDTTFWPRPDTSRSYATPTDSLIAEVDLYPPPRSDSIAGGEAEESTETLPEPDSTEATPTPPDTTGQMRPQRAGAPRPDSGGTGRSAPGTAPSPETNWELPTAGSEEGIPLEETRLFRSPLTWFERSQVWGDSIRVRAHERSLDTVYVRGAAFAAQQDTTIDRIQQLKGRTITAYFRRDSIQRILARPNGQAIRFSVSENDSLSGATRASGDFVELRFEEGDVRTVQFGPGIEGTAYHEKEHIPDPFRLEGFQWTPDRKPTKNGLLREQRVRERLNLGKRRAPPIARSDEMEDARYGPSRPDTLRSEPGASGASRLGPDAFMPMVPSDSSATPYFSPADSVRERLVPRPPEAERDTTDSSGSKQ